MTVGEDGGNHRNKHTEARSVLHQENAKREAGNLERNAAVRSWRMFYAR